ncbi:DUF2589 domain-containing protein [Laspinema olomoucense]|uniref:DUF2589 domain-containing protein n=1 Tax=Laspinema olomoucense D3b TaxID=2953688 RepID=A0ABT2NAU5_9CYAN|nr:DUF2589 domain-containing protein [Laspinema sp. D3b]MCT7979824.1 DUF2589 domain-containing protein [Laspinema sp. D3b]
MATSNPINVGDLLAAPLIATIQADFGAAQKFVEFITEYGFEKGEPPSGDDPDEIPDEAKSSLGQLRMLKFWYNRYNPRKKQYEEIYISIPVLSLIPLPLLQVNEAEFDFNIRIFAEPVVSPSPQAQSGALTGAERKQLEEGKAANSNYEFKAMLAPTSGQKSDDKSPTMDANMRIKIQMRQADLPGGIASMMTLFKESTSVTPKAKLKPSSAE